MTSTATRWRIAERLNKLKRTCWCDLVDYVLSHRTDHDASERQFLFRRTRDDGEVTRYSMLRQLVFGSKKARCQETAAKKGSCYCGKFATREVADNTSLRPGFIILGLTPEARMERPPPRTDGFLSA